jgi:transcription elongation GreA/GreB family factor
MTLDKQAIYETCLNTILDKENALKKLIAATRESNNDTKSSMGDKYETSREMLQQEINMLEKQLAEINQQHQVLKKIRILQSTNVNLGAVVEFELGVFYVAAGIGEIKVDNNSIMTISINSPLATAMLGKKKGESFIMNTKKYTIKDVS